MTKRDLRHKLLGHLLEGSGELIVRDVNRTTHCERCGGHLEMHTLPMTGHIVEECARCGKIEPIRRFLPVVEDDKKR
jgi:hypothetical protein